MVRKSVMFDLVAACALAAFFATRALVDSDGPPGNLLFATFMLMHALRIRGVPYAHRVGP